MLKYLEELREKVGEEKIHEEGIIMTMDELKTFFTHHGRELMENYSIRGHVKALYSTVDLRPRNPRGEFTARFEIGNRLDIRSDYQTVIELDFDELRKLDIHAKVYYSLCEWIDIHIQYKDDTRWREGFISLCFPPSLKQPSE